jgi:ketosteroid isomerase-like protein
VAIVGNDSPQHAWVMASNVYVKTEQGWRMVAHHASPGMAAEPTEATEARPVLH